MMDNRCIVMHACARMEICPSQSAYAWVPCPLMGPDADCVLILQQVEDLVIVLDESLRASASSIAQKLRKAGRRVDLVLEAKKMKWVFKVCATDVCNLRSQWRMACFGLTLLSAVIVWTSGCSQTRFLSPTPAHQTTHLHKERPRTMLWEHDSTSMTHHLVALTDTMCVSVQQAERCGAERLIIVAPDEWERGMVRVKNLVARDEDDMTVDELLASSHRVSQDQ